jgi:hypothetical protein
LPSSFWIACKIVSLAETEPAPLENAVNVDAIARAFVK